VKVGIDNSYLSLFLSCNSPGSVANASTKVQTLITDLTEKNATVIIPAPVLTECLVRHGTGIQETLEKLKKYSCFEVRPFDERAAIELAMMLRGDTKASARNARKVATASKISFDKQIVSVVKTHGASTIYSDDGDLCSFAKEWGLQAIPLAQLPVLPVQGVLALSHTANGEKHEQEKK
jgi:hypothetical protein